MLRVYGSSAATYEIARAYDVNGITRRNALGDLFPGLRRFVEPARVVGVELSQTEGGDYRKALLFWFSLFGLLVSMFGAASTAIVARISVNRGKEDALLKQVQIEKTKLEIEQLRVELERARLEAEQQGPRVVLTAG